LFPGEDESSPRQIQHEEDNADWENVKGPDVWLSRHRMQSRCPLLRVYPTVRSRFHINHRANNIGREQEYAPPLCRNVLAIQSFCLRVHLLILATTGTLTAITILRQLGNTSDIRQLA
jgi:hypothetical protein